MAKPRAEIPTKVPPEETNGTTEEKAEAKKNKRERKEERQKNRKKEKKELKSENQQENLRGQKSKKRKKGQEAGQEAGGEETTEAGGPPQKKKARGGQVSEEDAVRNGGPGENADKGQTKTGKGKQKWRKHSEGVCSARTLGSQAVSGVQGNVLGLTFWPGMEKGRDCRAPADLPSAFYRSPPASMRTTC